jgi:hypothetical protein
MSRRTLSMTRLMLSGALLLAVSGWRPAWAAERQSTGQQTVAAIPLDDAVMSGGLVRQAHVETLRPAPLPNPDVRDPGPSNETLAAQNDPSLAPDVFNPKSHFAGDGYEPGSSIENEHNHRHSTGGGMSLSIPMQ